ncbi:MAG: bifunctional 4-hydroxy-2-oxoglutarate aldolase/2-dehydro-3-deoxy-phosphogluconate aldolase [Marinoscillum sp.]
MKISTILSGSKILPAVTIENTDQAVKLAQAYAKGGLNLMEITFRTPDTAEAIRAIRLEVPNMIIGAGTILTTGQIEEAVSAGAHFGLAPGFNPKVVDAAQQFELPFIPGVMTPSEVESAFEKGCQIQKLFPINHMGGTNFLKTLNGPFGHTPIRFIPMGGINQHNMLDYLSLKNVIAVGGSWLCDQEKIRTNQFTKISEDVAATMATIIQKTN